MVLFYIIYNYYIDFVKGFVNKKQCIPKKTGIHETRR